MLDEELATDELRHGEHKEIDITENITEKLIAAMEGILQTNEAQASSISSIANAVSKIRSALESQMSAIHNLDSAFQDMKSKQVGEAAISDIQAKIRNLSDTWKIMLSESHLVEERLSRLEAKTDNINENVSGNLERLEDNIRQSFMSIREALDRNEELQKKINGVKSIAAMTSEAVEYMKNMAEINRETIRSLREGLAENAMMIEESKKSLQALDSEIANRFDGLSFSLGENANKIDDLYSSMKEKLDAAARRSENNMEKLSASIGESRKENEEFQRKIAGMNKNMEDFHEHMEEIKDVVELSRQDINDLRGKTENNATMIALNTRAVDDLKSSSKQSIEKMHNTVDKADLSIAELKERLNMAILEIDEKINSLELFTNRGIEDVQTLQNVAELDLKDILTRLFSIEQMIIELKPKKRAKRVEAKRRVKAKRPRVKRAKVRRRTIARRRAPARRPAQKPVGAVVDYAAIEELIVNYVRENNRATIDAIKGHTGIGETTLRKLLHDMVRKDKLQRQRQGKFVYYYVL